MARKPFAEGRFIRRLRTFSALLSLPVVGALVHLCRARLALAAVAVTAFVLLVQLPLPSRIRFGFRDEKRSFFLSSVLVPLYDVLWTGALFTPLPTLLAGIAALVVHPHPSFGAVCVAGSIAGFVISAYGVLVRRRWARVRRVEVAVEGLPHAFDGYRIVHLSDLHVGSTTRLDAAMRWVEKTNALDADLVAVTGDVLSSGTHFHDEVVEVLSSLRARDGVVGCLGNHDYYGESALCRALDDRGVRMLRNQGLPLRRGDARIFVAGVEDLWRGDPDLDRACEGALGAPVVLLAHNPDYFPVAREAGVALTLSGHTHAGQVAMPFLVQRANLSRIATRWTAGLYRDGGAALFVHAGLGTTGPTIRFGAAPEVVEIVLRVPGGAARPA